MKAKLLELLKNTDGYLSGEEIGSTLGVSRAAVWKNINALRKDGFVIEAVTNKGYKLSEEADIISSNFIEKNINNAVINLGGNVLCVGGKKNNASFNIGIKKPFTQSEETLMTVKLNNKSAVSSGTYERYFNEDSNFYHHILNPTTGYPYNNGLTQVTIISDQSIDGDCLSTTCFVLGLEKGLELIETLENTEAVFVMADGDIIYSSGMQDYINN